MKEIRMSLKSGNEGRSQRKLLWSRAEKGDGRTVFSQWDSAGTGSKVLQHHFARPWMEMISQVQLTSIFKTPGEYISPSLKFCLPCLVLEFLKCATSKRHIPVLSCYLQRVFIVGVCFVFNHHPNITTPWWAKHKASSARLSFNHEASNKANQAFISRGKWWNLICGERIQSQFLIFQMSTTISNLICLKTIKIDWHAICQHS